LNADDEIPQENGKYTLSELITKCQPIRDEQILLQEEALEDGLPKLQQRYYSMLNDPYNQA
jgi:hypothetical protein